MSKKFDIDKFIDELEMDEELAEFDLSEKKTPYRRCPKCGSYEWKKLYTTKTGRIKNCTECKDIHEQ